MSHSSLPGTPWERDCALEDELHVCASTLGPELARLARKLSKQGAHPHWRAFEDPSSERLVELFTLYEAGEMSRAAAAVFARVVARYPVLQDHLAPLREVWEAPLAAGFDEVTGAQVDAAFSELKARMTSAKRRL